MRMCDTVVDSLPGYKSNNYPKQMGNNGDCREVNIVVYKPHFIQIERDQGTTLTFNIFYNFYIYSL